MNATLSFGESIKDPSAIFEHDSIKKILEWQKTSEKQQWLIEDLRKITNKKARTKLKTKLPYIVGSVFDPPNRNTKNLVKTNHMIFDIDGIENIEELFARLEKEPFIHWMFRSPSGNGIKFGVILETEIKDSELYTKVYKFASRKLSEFYNIELDHTSDCARACFLSYDNNYHYKEDCVKFPIKYDIEKPKKIYQPTEFASDPDKEYQILQDICRQLSLCSYDEWYRAGMSLATLGWQGEELFCLLSLGKEHKDSESSVRRKFKTFKPDGEIQISTIYHIAKQNGIDVSELKRRYYFD